jgi:hypothetical protein
MMDFWLQRRTSGRWQKRQARFPDPLQKQRRRLVSHSNNHYLAGSGALRLGQIVISGKHTKIDERLSCLSIPMMQFELFPLSPSKLVLPIPPSESSKSRPVTPPEELAQIP